MKKTLICVMLCVMMVMLAGCGYPEMEGPSKEYELQEISNDLMSISCPADGWEVGPEYSVNVLSVVDSETKGNNNITVQVNTAYAGRITKTLMNELEATYSTADVTDGLTLTFSEMRKYNGSNIIYFEQDIKVTEEMIDGLIESQGLTEADVEAMGGRDAILAADMGKQMGIYYVSKGFLCVCTGTYQGEEMKETVLDLMKIAIDTTTVHF